MDATVASDFIGPSDRQMEGRPSATADAYQYSPLDATGHEIRVLDLDPGVSCERIECIIRHVRLSTEPSFETISYVWGDATTRAIIYVGGYSLSVPASSAAALRMMRSQHSIRTLWLDAVCIDQTNTEERNHQVALMRKVFSHGNLNLIYLGEVDIETSTATKLSLMQLVAEFEDETRGLEDFRMLLVDPQGYPRFSVRPLMRKINFDILLDFVGLPWFHRVWVMQEAALSAGSICHYGALRITLLDVVRAFGWLYHKRNYIPYTLFASEPVHTCSELHEDYKFKDGKWEQDVQASTGLTVAAALAWGNRHSATDPKDYVFGMLGTMKCTRIDIPSALVPDYDKSDIDVYQDATSYAIIEDGIARIFRCIRHREEQELIDLLWPSWVPKWHRGLNRTEDADFLSYSFMADDTTHEIIPRSTVVNKSVLQISGLKLGSVLHTCSPFTELCFSNLNAMRAILDEVQAKTSMALRTGEPDAEVKSRIRMIETLITGIDRDGLPVSGPEIVEYEAFVKIMNEEGKMPPTTHDVTGTTDETTIKAARFGFALYTAARNRRFILTEHGTYGLAPRLTQEGDIVVLLDGGPTPYVLRPWQDQYKLVGECYMRGVMYGEAMREHRASGKPFETFRIS